MKRQDFKKNHPPTQSLLKPRSYSARETQNRGGESEREGEGK